MNSPFKTKIGRTIAIILVVALIFMSGAFTGYFFQLNPTGGPDFNRLFRPFYQAWAIVHDQYLEQPVDDTLLMQGAIKGMMDSLGDPFTGYMDPEEYRQQNTPLQGEYTGIGAYVDTSGDALVFISPMPDSPAEAAGIQPGDTVIKIEGEDMHGVEPDLVLQRILGPEGTTVVITVEREGEAEPLEFTIERAVIAIPTVDQTMLEDQVGYIRLYSFSSNSADEFDSALTGLLDEGAQSLIVDLRSNSGGFVDTAVDIISDFLEKDATILIEEWGDGSRNEYTARGDPQALDIPMVVLVDAGTASASEIMAGALQDYGRATLIGTTTYGKGLIQNWIPLVDDSGAVRVTIARWLTPKEQQIQGNGLTPDITVEFTEEDIQAQNDVQLNAALEYLQNNNSD
ncbi:MAG: carboxyl-terminal processing protease [Chloroflexota bacterium]|nr:carboxyl-terminal processing protease [Chloroflexota bacterium]